MWAGRRWLALCAICVHITRVAPSSADAPTPPDRAKLAALLREGETSARAKKWRACAQAYSEALALEDAPRTAGELGLCEEQLLRFADAFRHLDRALDVAPTAPITDPWKRYQDAMVRLRSRVAVLFITVTPPDAAVIVDGRPVGRGDGRGIAVEPGEHTIAARLSGYEDAVKKLRVVAPSAPHIDLNLTPLAQAAAPLTAPQAVASSALPAPVIEAPRTRSLPPPLAWCVPERSARGVLGPAACAGVLAVAASGGVAIGLTADAQSYRDSLAARGFTGKSCAGGAAASPECAELESRGRQREIAQDVLIGTAIATGALVGMAGAAIALEPLNPRVAVSVSAEGGGFVLRGTW